MAKLNQIIAVANGAKSRTQSGVAELYHKLQKPALMQGLSKKYRPKDEEGELLPAESHRVQFTAKEAIDSAVAQWSTLIDVVATQDVANCQAAADVVVDGKPVIKGVPVTNLLFLEKQLKDVESFVNAIPVLDPGSEWAFSDEADCWATPVVETVRTKKIPRNHVKAEATDRFPAQVDVYPEDVVVGYWNKIDFSGAIPQREKSQMIDRVRKLQDAVKAARELANGNDVKQVTFAVPIFAYLFGTPQPEA